MPKSSDKADPSTRDPAFEDALSQLEELVREMESDQMPLEDLIRNYEQGTKLFQVCEKRLEEAEGRIEIIRKKRNGEAVVEPFDEEPTTTAAPASEEETEDHGELF